MPEDPCCAHCEATRKALEALAADFEAFSADAEAIINRNRCRDWDLMQDLIAVGEERAAAREAAERREKWRETYTRWASTAAVTLVLAGALWATFRFAVMQAGG